MTMLGELAVLAGVCLAAVGFGIWVAPGAGLVVGGLGLAVLGGALIWSTPDEETE